MPPRVVRPVPAEASALHLTDKIFIHMFLSGSTEVSCPIALFLLASESVTDFYVTLNFVHGGISGTVATGISSYFLPQEK